MPTCKLIVIDQVNVRFTDLDASVRRKIVEKLKFLVPYARHMPQFKLGRWDGKVGFATVGGQTFFNVLDRVLPIVTEAGYDIEVDDRRSHADFQFSPIGEDYFAETLWPEGHPMEGEPIEMRDHQVTAVNTYLENPQSMQEIATGAGKTIICAALSKSIEQYGRSLIIVPGKDLVRQTCRDYLNIGLDTGRYYGDFKEPDRQHTIATWQSLSALKKNNHEMLNRILRDCVSVIVDECFAPGTMVLTPRGYVAIETIKPGDRVINYCETTKAFKEDEVVKLHENISNEQMFELHLENDKIIQVTGNHKFLTERGWVRVDELTEDDDIISLGDRSLCAGEIA